MGEETTIMGTVLSVVFQNRQAHFAIVDQNVIASLHVLKQFRAGDVETLVRSFDFRAADLDDIAL